MWFRNPRTGKWHWVDDPSFAAKPHAVCCWTVEINLSWDHEPKVSAMETCWRCERVLAKRAKKTVDLR